MYCIRYNKIPDKWINGLPIGNGRLAAMYWGDGGRDILSLNNEYLWRGKHRNRTCEYAADKLPQLRDLLKNRDYFRATVFANLFFGGYNGDSGISEGGIDSFQPAGDIVFEFSEITKDCSCMLDIENGLITAERASAVRGKFFCDCNDGQIMTAWKNENGFDGKLSFRRCDDPEAKYNTVYEDNKITFFCSFICGICFEVIISIKTDGCTKVLSDGIYIKNAKEVICSTNIVLSDNDKRETDLDFEKLYLNHSKKFASYMHRMSFEIDADEPHICTDERIRRIRQGESDVKLQELFFHYGRYLMISSCISGMLPPNLQGKWNGEIDPPWGCDYHFDINLQMNEWMIEGADLSEFAEALTDFLLELIGSGREAAKKLYGCRGIWLPISTDVWGKCTPEAFGYTVWPGAAAWMAQTLWKHYIYTGDREYLEKKAYKFFREVALFYEDYLEEDEDGVMQIMPSQSPENRFHGAGSVVTVGICSSSAIDVQLAYDAFGYAAKSAEILGIDENHAKKWRELRRKLLPFRTGSDGRLLEWNEEFIEEQPGHKHLSHLYGLYPSDIFTPEKNRETYDAAVKSFKYRMAHNSGYTGWSRAWIANMYARIGDGEQFYKQTECLLYDFATESLLDIHPDPVNPGVGPDIFQIDGNFGMVSAVAEALCSYFDGKAHFLHALPRAWRSGRICGLKLPGGHTVSFEWKDGKVTDLKAIIGFGGSFTAIINGSEKVISGEQGEVVSFDTKVL